MGRSLLDPRVVPNINLVNGHDRCSLFGSFSELVRRNPFHVECRGNVLVGGTSELSKGCSGSEMLRCSHAVQCHMRIMNLG